MPHFNTDNELYISPSEFIDECSLSERQELAMELSGCVPLVVSNINEVLLYIYTHYSMSDWKLDAICEAIQEMKKGYCSRLDSIDV